VTRQALGWRPLLSILLAAVTGLAAAMLDTSRGFDDMGVLVTGLVLGAGLAGFVAGPLPASWIVLLALLAGLPVPVAELLAGGTPVAFAATVLAAIGVAVGWFAARLVATSPA
jgi:hypothetical protein